MELSLLFSWVLPTQIVLHYNTILEFMEYEVKNSFVIEHLDSMRFMITVQFIEVINIWYLSTLNAFTACTIN